MSGELKAMEAGYSINVEWCCNQMLKNDLNQASWPLGRNCLLSLSHLQYPVVLLIKVILSSYAYHVVSLVFPDHWLPFLLVNNQ